MASNDSKDDGTKGAGGGRPHVTLDLKAKTVGVSPDPKKPSSEPPGDASARAALQPPSAAASAKGGQESRTEAGDGAKASAPRRDAGPTSGAGLFLSHLMAALFGGLIAIVLTYYGVDQFRENLPILTDTGVATIRHHINALERRIYALETVERPSPSESRASEEKTAAPAVDPQLQERLVAATAQAEKSASYVKSLELRLSTLESRLARGELGSSAPAAPAASAATAAPDLDNKLRAEIDPLKSRVDALDRTLQGMSKWRVEQQVSQRSTAATTALGALRRAFDQGRPYETELRAVTELSPGPLDLGVLASRQSTGVETYARLVERFNAASKAALASVGRSKGGSFVGEALSRMQSAVRLKPADSPNGTEPEAVIARMEARVKSGDLAGAVREGQSLSEPAAGFFGPWMTDAETRSAGHEALGRAEAKLAGGYGDGEHGGRRGG
jgi:hypothetical protein